MAEVFSGRWRLRVFSKNTDFDQRLRIEGALTGNGIFDGVPGATAEAFGPTWTLTLEWNNNAGFRNIRRFSGGPVIDEQFVATAEQAGRHPLPHTAETDEPDFHESSEDEQN